MTYSTYLTADWTRLEQDWRAWWQGELERPIMVLHTRAPIARRRDIDPLQPLTQFPPDTPVDRLLEHGQAWLDALHYYADAYPNWWPNFGPGIMAGFLGSRVEPADGTAWFYPLEFDSLAELTLDPDPENCWWKTVRELTRAASARWGDRVTIGYTDLGGNLDILAHLRGTQNLLLDVVDAPDEIARLAPEITKLWLRYYDALDNLASSGGRGSRCWSILWYPSRGYYLQCDFSYMISPKAFQRFVLPDIDACCAALDYPFYHLDGIGAVKHLDMLLALPKLRGIQWVPGDGQPSADQWLDLLQRIRAGGKLCQVHVDRKGAMTIARELGGRGFAIDLAETLTDAEAEEFLPAFWAECARTNRTPGR